jgi:hypothetical protein
MGVKVTIVLALCGVTFAVVARLLLRDRER